MHSRRHGDRRCAAGDEVIAHGKLAQRSVATHTSASVTRRWKNMVRPSRVRRGGPSVSRTEVQIRFTAFVRVSMM